MIVVVLMNEDGRKMNAWGDDVIGSWWSNEL